MRQGAYFGPSEIPPYFPVLQGALPDHIPFFYTSMPNPIYEVIAQGRYWIWNRVLKQPWLEGHGGVANLRSYDILNAMPRSLWEAQLIMATETEEMWNEDDFDNEPVVSRLTDCYIQALAAASQAHDAFVGIPDGVDWLPTSAWATIEYPQLTQNPNVMRIYRVDPRPLWCGDTGLPIMQEPTLIWERARGDAPLQLGPKQCQYGAKPWNTASPVKTILVPLVSSRSLPAKRTLGPEFVVTSKLSSTGQAQTGR